MRRANKIARRRGFVFTTTRERRAADLFWADLLGMPSRSVAGEAEDRADSASASMPEVSPQLAGGAPAVGPAPHRRRPSYPAALIRQDGIDVYQENDVPSAADIRAAGISFVIHRCSIGGNLDTRFSTRYASTRAGGLIRGSYHYYLHRDGVGGDVQGNRVVAAVQRLGPGDLAPSLDFEEAAVATGSQEPATAAAWRTELEAFLDTVEATLGRTPLIYTRRSAWNSHVGGKPDYRAADFSHFGGYPLWVLNYAIAFHPQVLTWTDAAGNQTSVTVNFNADRPPKRTDAVFPAGVVGDRLFDLAKTEYRRQAWAEGDRLYARRQTINPPAASIPGPWTNWSFFQYLPFTPGSMRAHGFTRDYKVDFNVTRGGIYFLRGLADLGHTAPHLVGSQPCIAYTEPTGEIHLLEYVSGSWVDQEIARDMPLAPDATALPPAIGDPSAAALGNEEVIVYRSAAGRVHALTRNITGTDTAWHATDIGRGAAAFGDPFVLTFRNAIHVIYWDDSNTQVHVSRVNGTWQAESLADRPAGAATPSRIAGSGVAYPYQDTLHVVSRSRDAGHLFDFVTPPAGPPQDLTAASHGADGQTPAATYRPATYARPRQAPRIVFRALRGHIWEIERDTLVARDLSAAAAAPTAAGSPTAVATDTAHVLYRGIDGSVHEIYDDRGTWRTRRVCADATAASDPAAYVDERGHAAATFRTVNGPIRIVRLVGGQWTCEDA
jgi:GH25 family lysozyme M1 (1,4-beta-N-acetylmuramidase)